jgi:hypothetical protein
MATPGQPTSYKPEYDELAHSYCLLGATNEVLAGFFDVAPRTIDNWIATYPDFAADDIVALLDAAGESMRHAGD